MRKPEVWAKRRRVADPAPFVNMRVGRRRVLVEPGFDAAHWRAMMEALEERA